MITEKQKDLDELMQYLNIAKMPKEWNAEKSKKVWVDAILEVQKADGSTSYAYAYNNYGAEPIYKKVVGHSAILVGVLTIYPLNFLGQNYLPNFQKREEVVMFVSDFYRRPMEEIDKLDAEDIKKMVYRAAIHKQIAFMKEDIQR